LFIVVCALPNASISGEVARTRSSSMAVDDWPCVAANARYCRNFFAVSVLPAPDSPEMTTLCERESIRPLYDAAATPNTCGPGGD
jgi:hypothetical protein